MVLHSLDKHKNWELVENAKRDQQARRRLPYSYSDTDDISASSSSSSEESDEDFTPRVAVVEQQAYFEFDQNRKTEPLYQLRLAETFMKQKNTVNARIGATPEGDEEARAAAQASKYRVSTSRKGFTVRDRRPKGKRGVAKPARHNRHAAEVYDLARADVLIVAAPGPELDNFAYSHSHYAGCRCGGCSTPKANRYKRIDVKQQAMLDSL